ncbi:MAG TPA: UDP-N-acetylmuramoyl-L-alanyl-D-glutamate--2,6-diaminopimelate ligase [Solirubrobacteraceae bacterium]
MELADVMGDAAAGLEPVEVSTLAYDNRVVTPGTLFFCVRGFTRDGHEFADDAIARGAAALVVDHRLDVDVPQVVVPDVRAAMAPAAAALAGNPTARLRVAGVTGTNGKTTTAYLTRALLEAGGHRTGLLGTVASVIGGDEQPTVRTTPEAIDLQRTFAAMLDAGDTHCVMEVSSHALELHRADAIHWAAVVFTNLSQDHLDFHPSMEEYFQAKRRLFLAAGDAPRIVNIDDEHGRRLAEEFPGAVTYAIEREAVLRPDRVASDATGATIEVHGHEFRIPLPGRFNVLNALAAIGVAGQLGVGPEDIARGLATARTAPGRFQPVDGGQDFTVLVDYAHTPDALDNVLRAARELTGGRVIVVFGAGGDRDHGKRPLMGDAAVARADRVIVTSDNPRSEDPDAIIAEVAGDHDVTRIADRRAAIAAALAEAQAGDVVVIAGKGHEQGQEFAGGRKEPFDDVTVALEELRAAVER